MKKRVVAALTLLATLLLPLSACAPANAPTPSGSTLMEDSSTESNVWSNIPAFGSPTLTREQIRSVTFLSDTGLSSGESWDVSQKRDGSVIAWTAENENDGLYDLFIAADGGVIAPENCEYMFWNYENIESIVFNSNFDVSNVKNMRGMFSNCCRLTALDLSGFDTSNVTDMGGMFSDCWRLTALDLSGFDTSHVTNMAEMFFYCESLTALDISGFDTSNVTNMRHMFMYCGNLAKLDVSAFDTSHVTEAGGMFWACSGVTLKDTSGFDLSKVTDITDPRQIFLISRHYDQVDSVE